FALLVGDWKLNLTEGPGEPVRHLVEGAIILAAVVFAVFLASLLPALRWFFSQRNARRFFLLFLCVATVAALFYAEEDWRGARAWEKYRERMAKEGEQLD